MQQKCGNSFGPACPIIPGLAEQCQDEPIDMSGSHTVISKKMWFILTVLLEGVERVYSFSVEHRQLYYVLRVKL